MTEQNAESVRFYVPPTDESNRWPNIQCPATERHPAHRHLGRCGFPEWCRGVQIDSSGAAS